MLSLGVRRIAQQREDALPAQLAEARQIDHLAVDGREIDLEVAGVDDRADRRENRKAAGIGDRMVDSDEFDRQLAQPDLIAGLDDVELRLAQVAGLLELALDEADREARGIDRDVQLLEQVAQRADVVLVAVSDDDAAHPVAVFDDVAEIWNDQIDAEHVVIRERKAAVDDDDIVLVFDDGHVLADLAETAQRDDLERALPALFRG